MRVEHAQGPARSGAPARPQHAAFRTQRAVSVPAMSQPPGGPGRGFSMFGPKQTNRLSTSSFAPPRPRNNTNTLKLHRGKGSDEDDPELAAEAQAVVEQWWETVIQGTALPGQPVSVQGNQQTLDLLQLLLPCLNSAVTAKALNDVALRHVADEVGRLSTCSLDFHEQKVLALFQGLMSRSQDAEPEERVDRNSLSRLLWESFAETRVTGRTDMWGRSVAPALQEYRQSYRKKCLRSLQLLVAYTLLDRTAMSHRLVLLRGLVGGSMSHMLLRHPKLLQLPLDLLKEHEQHVGEGEGALYQLLVHMERLGPAPLASSVTIPPLTHLGADDDPQWLPRRVTHGFAVDSSEL